MILMLNFLFLVPIGFLVGGFGTLIGAGGGFILVPILLLLYPHENADTITSISLAVVFFNSLAGTISYSRLKRIDYKSGIIFAIATIPGSIFGSLATGYMPRNLFNGIFGFIMILIGIFLIVRKTTSKSFSGEKKKRYLYRSVVDSDGIKYEFSYNPIIGVLISIVVGFLSSFLGIGGGIIHVPALVNFLNFPVHIATATSHFILVIMSFSGTMVHLINGVLSSSFIKVTALSIGAILGAPIGAKLSNKLKGNIIIKSLALALIIAGVRIFLMAF
jgi:uncharacterized membrane protein YfcA